MTGAPRGFVDMTNPSIHPLTNSSDILLLPFPTLVPFTLNFLSTFCSVKLLDLDTSCILHVGHPTPDPRLLCLASPYLPVQSQLRCDLFQEVFVGRVLLFCAPTAPWASHVIAFLMLCCHCQDGQMDSLPCASACEPSAVCWGQG